jgi:uncharacterized membrane protein
LCVTYIVAVITVISISFSITILALQQMATQYSPRVLHNFTRERGHQAVLGTYLGTFIYALLILRAIRSEAGGNDTFVPMLAVNSVIALAVLCTCLLIYFITRIVTSLQVDHIIHAVHKDATGQTEFLYPDTLADEGEGDGADVSGQDWRKRGGEGGEVRAVKLKRAGFVQSVNEERLAEFRTPNVVAVYVVPQVGDYVAAGQDGFLLHVLDPQAAEDEAELSEVLSVGYQRSNLQDLRFGISQLVDIALRALSTGVNDPATAESVIYRLGSILGDLAQRRFPSPERVYEGNRTVFIHNLPTWPQYVEEAFGQIRRAASDSVRTTATLTRRLTELARLVPAGPRREPIVQQLQAIREQVSAERLIEPDRRMLLTLLDEALSSAAPATDELASDSS